MLNTIDILWINATISTLPAQGSAVVEKNVDAWPSGIVLQTLDPTIHGQVIQIATPQLVAGALSGVAGALWTRYLDLDAARARPRVLAAAVAAALGVAAADVTISVRNRGNTHHSAILAAAPHVSERLRSIPATGASDAFAAVGAALDAHFAPPSSSEEDEDGDAAAAPAPAPLLPLNGQRIFLQGFLGDHKRRLKTLVESYGGAVVGRAASPTLAIFPDNHASTSCRTELSHLQPRYRIVRERWLLRVSAAAPLPDFMPDAVYARVRVVRDPGSYFYGAVADADMTQNRDDDWKVIPEDWTFSA